MPDFWLSDAEEAKRLFLMLEAVDWKWTIEELERQDEARLHDVLALKAAKSRLMNTPGDGEAGGGGMQL